MTTLADNSAGMGTSVGTIMDTSPRAHVRRLELRLARPLGEPLKELSMDPDVFFEAMARQFGGVSADPAFAESAEVLIDLVPVSGARGRRLRKKIAGHTGRPDLGIGGGKQPSASGFLQQIVDEAGFPGGGWGKSSGSWFGPTGGGGKRGGGRMTPGAVVEHRVETQQLTSKVGETAMFEVQVLIRVTSLDEGRANAMVKGLLSAFRIFAGHNEFRVTGLRVFGSAFLGADVFWRRRWFDQRARTGYFRPPGSWRGATAVLNAGEVAPFLHPPTKWCLEDNVVRSGPYLASAPATLPAYTRQAGVAPMGRVWRHGREELVGMDLSEFYFGGIFGRSRQGKTELALNILVHIALCERAGAFFLDPHIDGVERVKPYLTGAGVRERVIEMNLSKTGEQTRHVGWNPLAMTGLDSDAAGFRARALADGFSVAAGWSSKATPRTSAILDNALSSLLHIALRLPAGLQPTVFTIPRLLLDDVFRAAVMMHLPKHLSQFWAKTYLNYGPDAAGPICQLISRLQTIPTVRATLGAAESTYDPRRAMDTGRIVLASPSSVTDTVVSALMLQAHIDAARSRKDIPKDQRALFYFLFDEAQTFDAVDKQGSALAAFLEQLGKYGICALLMAQSPHRLTEPTLEALATNASAIATTATAPKAARFFQDQWGADGDVDAKRAVQRLARYRYIMQLTHEGARRDPFRMDGLPLETMWADHQHPESLAVLDTVVDAQYRPRTVKETLDAIEHHDDKILHWLINGGSHGDSGGGGGGRPRRPDPAGPTTDDDAELDALADGWDVQTVRPERPGPGD